MKKKSSKPDARPAAHRNFASERAPRDVFLSGGVRIVHEDADIIVADKPTGLLTVSLEDENRDNVFALIKRHVREQVKRRGTKVWVIHRLDKEASGLVVFAKSESAFKWLKEDLRSRRVRRVYFATLEGELPGRQVGDIGSIQTFLEEGEDGVMRAVPSTTIATSRRKRNDQEATEAKLAVTHYRVRAIANGHTLLELKLDTGRKNQIRAHMAHLGHPIVGDRRYGATTDTAGRVCLHAAELDLTQPATGKPLSLRSEIPPSFLKLVGLRELGAAPAPTAREPQAPSPQTQASSWDHVAEWYDELVERKRSDHHDKLIIPGAMRLLNASRGMRSLDVACGQGVLCEQLAQLGIETVGVDASPRLIAAAKRGAPHGVDYMVGDARDLGALKLGEFDRISCIMALMNIEPLTPVMRGVASALKPGGFFVAVVLHPAFRAPGQTAWGWASRLAPKAAESGGPRGRGPATRSDERDMIQFRRVDGYLSPGQSSIVMNPGDASKGREKVVTWTYHRPIQSYVKSVAEAGLMIDAIEEWPSLRTSEPGPRAAEENRARREIPMFLAIRAVKPS